MKKGLQCLSGKGEILPFFVCFIVWVGISGNGRRPGCSPQSLEELELCLVGFCVMPSLPPPCAGQLEAVRTLKSLASHHPFS